MKTPIALAGLVIALLPTTILAAPVKTHAVKTHAVKTAPMYECQKCHMKVSAVVARKDHFKDPMDGGTLLPVKAAARPASTIKSVKTKTPQGAISM